ncbi:hypothetical protein DM860_003777 [Cuscuta australis]|uniref:Uncharacterized protein n=1 Tax=Cuscuta australis TaxID=267555 RepID=A0A328DKA6_9ASTE|nr:hypothetical protein DM860_003777 [Cuscuta australis]
MDSHYHKTSGIFQRKRSEVDLQFSTLPAMEEGVLAIFWNSTITGNPGITSLQSVIQCQPKFVRVRRNSFMGELKVRQSDEMLSSCNRVHKQSVIYICKHQCSAKKCISIQLWLFDHVCTIAHLWLEVGRRSVFVIFLDFQFIHC